VPQPQFFSSLIAVGIALFKPPTGWLALLSKVNIASVAMIPRRSCKAQSLRRAESNSPTTSSLISTIIMFGQLDPNAASAQRSVPKHSFRINLQRGHQA